MNLGSSQTINNYWHGNTEPKANFLEAFIKEFRVSAEWLMTGEGQADKKYQILESKNESVAEIANETSRQNTKTETLVKTYSCPECIAKQKEIDALNKALEAKEELLEMYREKKSEGKCG